MKTRFEFARTSNVFLTVLVAGPLSLSLKREKAGTGTTVLQVQLGCRAGSIYV